MKIKCRATLKSHLPELRAHLTTGLSREIPILVVEHAMTLHDDTAHFHDVTYNQIGSKMLQELTKSPARNTRAILEH